MRRLDMQDQIGRVPVPDVGWGRHLIDIVFQLGPIRGDMPLSEADLEPWERRRGIELAPYEAELIVGLSQAYMQEAHAAKSPSALAPWPPARNMWKYTMDQKHLKDEEARKKAQQQKEQQADGNRKRRRNPPPG